MTADFQFQDPGEGIREAEVLDVLVSVGDSVSEGQDLVVVETDKAAFELASPRSGTVEEVTVREGDRIAVGDVLLRYSEDAPETSSPGAGEERPRGGVRSSRGEEERPRGEPSPQEGDEEPGPRTGARARGDEERHGGEVVRATPAIRRLARELEVDLHSVEPSGEDGRVLAEDVRSTARPRQAARGRRGAGSRSERDGREEGLEGMGQETPEERDRYGLVERVRLRSVRRRTAERMATSWAEVARVTHHDEADVTELEGLRQRLSTRPAEGHGARITWTVLIVKAVAALLLRHPRFNATYDAAEATLVLKRYLRLGVAVDSGRGLLVPVLAEPAAKSLTELAQELVELAEAATRGNLRHDQLVGGTFTITNVGPIGGTGLTPVVNPPEVAILGVGQARLASVVTGTLEENHTRIRLILPLSLSFDHRVIDGAEGARFMRDLVALLGDPDRFLATI